MFKLSSDKYYSGEIRKSNRTVLSKAITLCESSKREHKKLARKIVEQCYPHSCNSLRIGITGAPGVGKSTFIEALGNYLLSNGQKIAVLAIDPSSTKSSGSILGDKTRMEKLAGNENVFIRPSPSSCELGGTGTATRDAIILCEAAGYEIIFIETVGVGQSETDVHSMVDFFLLLTIAGTGDELQGMKRGIMEIADMALINKADKENQKKYIAELKFQLAGALQLLSPSESGWLPKTLTCSSLTGEGLDAVWKNISDYFVLTKQNGFFIKNRTEQIKFRFREHLDRELRNVFYGNKHIKKIVRKNENEVMKGKVNPVVAAREIVEKFVTIPRII